PWPTGCGRAPFPEKRGAMRAAIVEARAKGPRLVALAPWCTSTPLLVLLATVGCVLIGQGLYIHAKALLAQVLLERAFTQSLEARVPVKPWSWADTWPVARVSVPRIGKSAIVLAGSSGQALAFGPGQIERTPDAGEEGTAIYAAHRDTHFAFLKDVRVGDDILVTRRDGKTVRFPVTPPSPLRS